MAAADKRLLHEGPYRSRYYPGRKTVKTEPLALRDILEQKLSPEFAEWLKKIDHREEIVARKELKNRLDNSENDHIELRQAFKGLGPITKELDSKQLADHTVSIMRGEIAVMAGSSQLRGVDVVRIACRKIGQDSSGLSRGEPERAPILMETGKDLGNIPVRPFNLVTETVSQLIDGSSRTKKKDQEILEATLKRAIQEEILTPLASSDCKKETISELATWLASSPKFETMPGKEETSSSTGLRSFYNLHNVTLFIPNPPTSSQPTELSEEATKLLRKLWNTQGIKRSKEKDNLVWKDLFSSSRIGPFYYRNDNERLEIEQIQESRDEDLRIATESRPPILDSSKELSDDEWENLVPKTERKDFNLELGVLGGLKTIKSYVHKDDWDNLINVIRHQSNGGKYTKPGKGKRAYHKLVPFRTCLFVKQVVDNIGCKDCRKTKGEKCTGEDLYNDRHTLSSSSAKGCLGVDGEPLKETPSLRYKAHESRLMAYTGINKTGGYAIPRALSKGIRYKKARIQSITHPEVDSIRLTPGRELHQIKLLNNKLTRVKKFKKAWDPNPDQANPSQNNGWWPPVHIDQTPSDMRRIARAMRNSDYTFAVLRSETPNQRDRCALGLISWGDLEKLADRLG